MQSVRGGVYCLQFQYLLQKTQRKLVHRIFIVGIDNNGKEWWTLHDGQPLNPVSKKSAPQKNGSKNPASNISTASKKTTSSRNSGHQKKRLEKPQSQRSPSRNNVVSNTPVSKNTGPKQTTVCAISFDLVVEATFFSRRCFSSWFVVWARKLFF